jgi:hypothetical protein
VQNNGRSTLLKGPLPVILIAAVFQGWVLYALHQAIEHKVWPATDTAWLSALYCLAVVAPLTIQVLSEHAKSRTFWVFLGLLCVSYFYFGWHHGADVFQQQVDRLIASDEFIPVAFILGLLWLLSMPFIQGRMVTGRWDIQYALLFTTAWRNTLMLAEAGLFTGLFWLLLMLWQALFRMLGIDFFKELFEEPVFIYPITTLVFGIALHLIGSVERVTVAILEQLLNVLKWLTVIAGIILTLFTVALVFKLPGLVFEGQKAIGAAWLLWLVAVIVLLINAAYRDGSIVKPYPNGIAFALRCVVPLTVIVSAVAVYALAVRARHYGVTVERVGAFIVAGTALAYSFGYSIAAVKKGPWLEGIGRVNVIVALALIAVIAATMTPLLSPYRLAAISQYRMALTKVMEESAEENRNSSFHYLRFDSGRYGQSKLGLLSALQDHSDAERIRAAASAAMKMVNRWDALPANLDEALANMRIYPANRKLDPKLRKKIEESMDSTAPNRVNAAALKAGLAGIFVDVYGDDGEEFVLLHQSGGNGYRIVDGEWQLKGSVRLDSRGLVWAFVLQAVADGDLRAEVPEWKGLKIGDYRYRVTEEP